MGNNDIKLHISVQERTKWDKVVVDFANHLGAGGTQNHMLGNGTVPGFSTNDFNNQLLVKLNGIEDGALNNPHPTSHPASMITGLSAVATSGRYSDLIGIPATFIAGGGDSDTVGGVRISVGPASMNIPNPKNNKDVWFETTNKLVKVYYNNAWNAFCAVYA